MTGGFWRRAGQQSFQVSVGACSDTNVACFCYEPLACFAVRSASMCMCLVNSRRGSGSVQQGRTACPFLLVSADTMVSHQKEFHFLFFLNSPFHLRQSLPSCMSCMSLCVGHKWKHRSQLSGVPL